MAYNFTLHKNTMETDFGNIYIYSIYILNILISMHDSLCYYMIFQDYENHLSICLNMYEN